MHDVDTESMNDVKQTWVCAFRFGAYIGSMKRFFNQPVKNFGGRPGRRLTGYLP